MKKLPNIITLLFLFIFALQLASLVFLVVAPEISQAAGTTELKLQVPIGATDKLTIGKTTEPIGIYIQSIYKYAVGVVGILATVVMMFGGVLWIVAGGNAERIGNAKAWIGAALTGLILVMTSYMILYTINPELVRFKPRGITSVDKKVANYEGTTCSIEDPCEKSFNCVDGRCYDGSDGDPCKVQTNSSFQFCLSYNCGTMPNEQGVCNTAGFQDKCTGSNNLCSCSSGSPKFTSWTACKSGYCIQSSGTDGKCGDPTN